MSIFRFEKKVNNCILQTNSFRPNSFWKDIVEQYRKDFFSKENADSNGNLVVLIDVDDRGGVSFSPKIQGLNVNFLGKNSCVIIFGNTKFENSKIKLKDNSCVVIKHSKFSIKNLKITAFLSDGLKFLINENFSCCEAEFTMNEGDCFIGEDCQLSFEISIWGTDGHAILDLDNNLINPGRDIYIGNHVWIGHRVEILKGAIIPDNCVIGAQSVVTKQFPITNSIIAGNPATVIKKNIKWDRRLPRLYNLDCKR